MALRVKKVRFPKELLVTDYQITLYAAGISEEGEPIIALKDKGKCIFSEKTKRIIDKTGKQVTLIGKAIMEGDIAPNLKAITDGIIEVNGVCYEIYSGARPRNPNGTIFSTNLELM